MNFRVTRFRPKPYANKRFSARLQQTVLRVTAGATVVLVAGSGCSSPTTAPELAPALAAKPSLVAVYDAKVGEGISVISGGARPSPVPSQVLPSLPSPKPGVSPAKGFTPTAIPMFEGACPTKESLPEDRMSANGIAVMRCGRALFPGVKEIGGIRSGPCGNMCDHQNGLAVDLMVDPLGQPTTTGKTTGDTVAAYFQRHATRFGIRYIIWQQRIWNAGVDNTTTPPSAWRMMADRGNPTDNHMDHVHISVN